MKKTYLAPVQSNRAFRVQSSGAATLADLQTLRRLYNLSPTEAAVYFLETRRNLSPIDIARETGMRLVHLLQLRRDAMRKVALVIQRNDYGSAAHVPSLQSLLTS